MARFLSGPNVGAVSGSVGNTKHSGGHYGQFLGVRRPPCRRETAYTVRARTILSEVSGAWGTLDATEKAAWGLWAASNPVVDRLGQSVTLSGHGAFCEVNTRLRQCDRGIQVLPPTGSAPTAVGCTGVTVVHPTFVIRLDLVAGFDALGLDLMVWAEVGAPRGSRRWLDRMKLVKVVPAGWALPVNLRDPLVERFGALKLGMAGHVRWVLLDPGSGLIGSPGLDSFEYV